MVGHGVDLGFMRLIIWSVYTSQELLRRLKFFKSAQLPLANNTTMVRYISIELPGPASSC